jgi:hypothetical protein
MPKKLKKLSKQMKSQAGWTTMEYVVGAIALVVVIKLVIDTFGEKLVAAVGRLVI